MIDCEALLDQCYALLNRAYEESYGKGYRYGKLEFRFVLSHDEIMALREHVAKTEVAAKVFVGVDKNILFGHELCEQRKTPYLEAIVGTVGAMK
ncbi:hypothetical protein LCGC14_2775340 [marine sediment metagenome]|uniref:Uncharacterized protein n=1 Tax=marine sediment metagenome TaxID=412755 RepID=A0A0F8YUS9_9ZZZZ